MNIKPFGKVSFQEIMDYSTLVDFHIPDIYSYFLMKTNGGIVKDNSLSFTLSDGAEQVQLEKFFGFDLSDEDDIVEANNILNDELPPNSLVIASGSGGYYVMVNSTVDSLLYFWDFENKLSISNENSNAYLITDSFDAFWHELGEIYIEEGETLMEKTPYVPLGSIILLTGSFEKVIIIGRGLIVKTAAGDDVIFDYAGVTYPEGLVGDHVAYFNHKDVAKVVFEGFSDEADTITVDNINNFIAEHPEIERGSVDNWD